MRQAPNATFAFARLRFAGNPPEPRAHLEKETDVQPIPSQGSQYIVKTIFEWSGPGMAAGLNVAGAIRGASASSVEALQGTAMQIIAASIDACCGLVMEATKDVKGVQTLPRPSANFVAGYIAHRVVGFGQLAPSSKVVFGSACAAVALDVALCLAFPPAGVGIAICALGLAIDGWCVGGAAANWQIAAGSPVRHAQPPGLSRWEGPSGVTQGFRNPGEMQTKGVQVLQKLQRDLPRMTFYNFKPDPTAPKIWY